MPLTDKEKQKIRERFGDLEVCDVYGNIPKENFYKVSDYFLSIIEEQRIKVLEGVEKEIRRVVPKYHFERGVPERDTQIMNEYTRGAKVYLDYVLEIITKAKGV